MYFPYLRGRQYELLALRELVVNGLLSEHIIPIIEPVKLSATLVKTMAEFNKCRHNLSVIQNPAVGSFNSDMNDSEKDSYKIDFIKFFKEKNTIKAHILQDNTSKILHSWEKRGVSKKDWLIINTARDFLHIFEEEFNVVYPKYVLIPDESAFRRKVKRNRVLLDDKFEKQRKNADYIQIKDEIFSDDHLYYSEDGFVGFGDYSIVGNEFLETGFAPYAVAIHIVYFADDRSLRIKHFVSDTNEDITNPALKFYEAVKKLADWCETDNVPLTMGLREFLQHYKQQTYPGLGSVKKLSIMHHLELMGSYLDGED